MSESVVLPDYSFSARIHLLQSAFVSAQEKEQVYQTLLASIKSQNQSGFYRLLCSAVNQPLDETVLSVMEESNGASLAAIDAEIEAAKQTAGDSEVKTATAKKIAFFLEIGNFVAASSLLEVAKPVGAGAKIDQHLLLARIGNFSGVPELTALAKKGLTAGQTLCESGGDWERRNKLLVYAMVDFIGDRKFHEASENFRRALTTFTCTEMSSYRDFVFRGLIASLASVDRQSLRKLIEAPEVISVFQEIPGLSDFLHALHVGRYAEFFRGLPVIMRAILRDRVLAKHWKFLVRNFRLRAYRQFLTAFKSVKLETMASEFGVTAAFLESEISDFIFCGKLACKIDQVTGIVESGGERNDQYTKILKAGDAALNKLQKLAKVMDM